MAGLEAAVDKEIASLIAKGCKVHFIRSVKRVSERISKGSPLAQKAFTTIAYHIPKVETPEDVVTLFNVLAGEDVSQAAALMPKSSVVQQYSKEHKPCTGRNGGNVHDIFVSAIVLLIINS